jgi:hypothetical protein
MSFLDHKRPRLAETYEMYLELAQYPILADQIRARMRQELFTRGIVDCEEFEREAEEKAVQSQKREGLTDPFAQEAGEIWKTRLRRVRDNLTDFYFAHNLPHDLFEEIVQVVVNEGAPHQRVLLTFNPELAPQDVLFTQAERYEVLPDEDRAQVQHHLEEIRVVLIKGMVSDQLAFVSRAKEFLTLEDLKGIYRRRIGGGKIGGKAAGLLLAWQALQRDDPEDHMGVGSRVTIPDSYFIGSDVYYHFKAMNDLVPFMDQKYKTREDIEAEYPGIQSAYAQGRFPSEVLGGLGALLAEVGSHPLIVRSSSLLEDSFAASFAGKYESVFCPNQGTQEENLQALTDAISRIYASVLSPEALVYRRQQALTDYDERMAVLIQKVQGGSYGHFFFPTLAGVAFGQNPFRWTQRIRREDGLVRLVWGLGTRAVERVANDYPRMIALSHPGLRPETRARDIHRYSQRFIDLLDLDHNLFRTLPIADVISEDYPHITELASLDHGDWIQPLYGAARGFDVRDIVLTFDNLLKNTDLVPLMRAMLHKLQRQLRYIPDIEFTVDIDSNAPRGGPVISLLQCRPLSTREWAAVPAVPTDIQRDDQLFSARRLVPQGYVPNVGYVVYVDPKGYAQIPDAATKTALARVVGRLNKCLEGQRFILIGPGRWGSIDLNLGVRVNYSDIYNASVLVEVAVDEDAGAPEASYGTHFFQDLVEAHIYPLAVHPDDPYEVFNWAFFEQAPNQLQSLLPDDSRYGDYLKVIDVAAFAGGRLLHVVMNGEDEEALGYLAAAG